MEKQADKTSFIFYKSFYESIKDLPNENQLEVYNLIFDYCFFGIEPKNSNTATAIFKLIKPNIDANNKRYFANIENGKKGGRPSNKKTQSKPKRNPNETQQNPTITFNEDVDVDVDVDEDVNVNKKKKNIFVPPRILEIKEYLNEKQIISVDAEKFYYFYESKNWMIGRNKMKCWKSAVNTWKKSSGNVLPQHPQNKQFNIDEYMIELTKPQRGDKK